MDKTSCKTIHWSLECHRLLWRLRPRLEGKVAHLAREASEMEIFTQHTSWLNGDITKKYWLVVWNMFMTFHILGILIPTDFHIFQRGRSTTNQSLIPLFPVNCLSDPFMDREGCCKWPCKWQCKWPYGYGSIPINTIFRGMNIHLPAILMWTKGVQGFDTLPYILYPLVI